MHSDAAIFAIVFALWLVLAGLYATVPMFAMPGYAVVWGWGSVVFLLLAGIIAGAVRRGRRRSAQRDPRD
jgi:membrane protein implicated in regulation of membrane protease activity